MAQLIKLQDYVSRYEWDAYRYPTQYIRLKKDNWNKLYHQWSEPSEKISIEAEDFIEDKPSVFSKWNVFKRTKDDEAKIQDVLQDALLPKTETELKQYYLDQLFPFQLKWATSTVREVSFVDRAYTYDPDLKYLLQRFPDNFLIMYDPVFSIKNAPMDGNTIIISPIGIEIIHLIKVAPEAVIIAGDERIWTIDAGETKTKMLNPNIALKRTEQIVRSIIRSKDIEFPITKTIIARDNQIICATAPYNTQMIDFKTHEAWHQERRSLNSPLKANQLKSIEALLSHCQTTSVKRPEWEEDENMFIVGEAVEEEI